MSKVEISSWQNWQLVASAEAGNSWAVVATLAGAVFPASSFSLLWVTVTREKNNLEDEEVGHTETSLNGDTFQTSPVVAKVVIVLVKIAEESKAVPTDPAFHPCSVLRRFVVYWFSEVWNFN